MLFKSFLFQINAVLFNFIFIKESSDTEDWSNGCWKLSFAIT